MLISETNRKFLMTEVNSPTSLKVIVEGQTDSLADVIGEDLISKEGNVYWLREMPTFLFFDFRLKFKRNKGKDKMEVHLRPTYTTRQQLIPFVYSTPIHKRDSIYDILKTPDVTRIQLRASIIAGFAISALTVSSNASGYLNNQAAKNRHFKVYHPTLEELIRPHVTLTGDFKKDFRQAFIALWFHYPYDITGEDTHLKMASLRMSEAFNTK